MSIDAVKASTDAAVPAVNRPPQSLFFLFREAFKGIFARTFHHQGREEYEVVGATGRSPLPPSPSRPSCASW